MWRSCFDVRRLLPPVRNQVLFSGRMIYWQPLRFLQRNDLLHLPISLREQIDNELIHGVNVATQVLQLGRDIRRPVHS